MRNIKVNTLINGYEIIHDAILVLDNHDRYLAHFSAENFEGEIHEHFDGYVCPGFVNAHCHLELSHLKNKIAEHTGLVDFILNVQKLRASNPDEIQQAIELAELEMIADGIVAVGDISNGSNSFAQKAKGNITYHTFLEALSFTPSRAEIAIDQMQQLKAQLESLNLSASISPHAPYSVSQELFKGLETLEESVYTIHHLESAEEQLFLTKKLGVLKKIYESFNIDISFFAPNFESSSDYWLPHFQVKKLVLVHNTFLDDYNYALITQAIPESYFCLCVNANLYIENRVPDIPSLIKKTKNICIGTDSLASNHQLSIRSEIESIRKHFPEIPMEFLLQCATIKGAEALGIEGAGVFVKGGRVNRFEHSSIRTTVPPQR